MDIRDCEGTAHQKEFRALLVVLMPPICVIGISKSMEDPRYSYGDGPTRGSMLARIMYWNSWILTIAANRCDPGP